MKNITKTAFFLLIVLLAACNNKTETPPQGSTEAGTPATGSGSDAMQTAPMLQQSGAAMPAAVAPVANTAAPASVTVPATTTAPGMNPPHGQPLHRCDIAVGAPLNSPPGKVPTKPAPAPTQTITPPGQSAATPTLPGMNPPHGQAGHRCDIAVGSPLSSPPTKKTEAAAVSSPVKETVTPTEAPK